MSLIQKEGTQPMSIVYKDSGTGIATSFFGTGTIQTFQVPLGIRLLEVYIWGGGGQTGGAGGFVSGRLVVNTGQILQIIVGMLGLSTGAQLARGGGAGYVNFRGGFGGGFSGIFNGFPTQASALAIAGGGGGGLARNGGGGGYPAGLQGAQGGLPTAAAGGGGGTQTAGGSGSGGIASPGTALTGGNANGTNDIAGGSGGGGWFGGGGGRSGSGGGGGSSYIDRLINPTFVNGVSGINATGPAQTNPYWQSPFGNGGQNGLVVIVTAPWFEQVPPQIRFNQILFTSIPGLRLWMDGTSGMTGNVWFDKSPSSNNATRTGGTITTTTVNGLQALSFASVRMTYANNLTFSGTTGSSCFFVVSPANANNDHLLSIRLGSDNALIWTDGNLYENIGFSSRQTISGFSLTTLQLYTNIANRSGNTVIFRDGNQIFSATYGSAYTGEFSGRIGGDTGSWTGTVCEYLVYGRTLTIAEQQQIEVYLARKWGLLGVLSIGNPYRSIPSSPPSIRYSNQTVIRQTVSFLGTGSIQTWTVPAGVTNFKFFLWGSGGTGQNGATNVNTAGGGAFVEGNILTTPGTVFYIIVGRRGVTGLANGGGSTGGTGAGGGGFSGIFSASPAANTVIAIAGGGAGSGFNARGYGGGGGYPNGSAGTGSGTQGGGGTQIAGGTSTATPGSQLAGGNGGGLDNGGGGGGGGWYGGGGGNNFGAGGGGSSTYITSVINPVTANGGNGGVSQVTPTPAGGESSPYWVSPLGRAGQNGLVVIGYS